MGNYIIDLLKCLLKRRERSLETQQLESVSSKTCVVHATRFRPTLLDLLLVVYPEKTLPLAKVLHTQVPCHQKLLLNGRTVTLINGSKALPVSLLEMLWRSLESPTPKTEQTSLPTSKVDEKC